MTEFSSTVTLENDAVFSSAFSLLSKVSLARAPRPVRNLSGAVVNQNQHRTGIIPISDSYIYQEFKFPSTYPRGTYDRRIPDLTGIQVCVDVAEGYAEEAGLDYRVEFLLGRYGWITLVAGMAVGAPADLPEVWFNMTFPPHGIEKPWNLKWRFGIKSRPMGGVQGQEVTLSDDQQNVIIANTPVPRTEISSAPLDQGESYPFVFRDPGDGYREKPSIVSVKDNGKIFFSNQQGVQGVWAATPNPLAANQRTDDCKAKGADGVTPLNVSGQETSLLFRVLSMTADSGKDFLGNNYRSFVIRSDKLKSTEWMSKPNPVKTAVESLYFDIRERWTKTPLTVEGILLDPLTPGVWVNAYWSRDPEPGIDEDTWDHHFWTPVNKQYQMKGRGIFSFPRPITANFIKVEFTNLQARPYEPHDVAKMEFKLFPQWVKDWYNGIFTPPDPVALSGNTTTLEYDAHDLLYNIPSDENGPDPVDSVQETSDANHLNDFLGTEDTSQASITTIANIQTNTQPFQNPPFAQGRSGDILQDQAGTNDQSQADYSTEISIRPSFDSDEIASDDLSGLKATKGFLHKRFYIPCRHYYRKVVWGYTHNRAFFVGLKRIAMVRKAISAPHNPEGHRWVIGDEDDLAHNDFAITRTQTQNLITPEDG